jgi:acylphosphatase
MTGAHPIRTVHVLIEGRVQGVYYRAWTEQTARELGLHGWVKNRRGGAVEAVFSGDPVAVDTMLRRCEEGPPDALVASVTVIAEGGSVPDGFSVRPTG